MEKYKQKTWILCSKFLSIPVGACWSWNVDSEWEAPSPKISLYKYIHFETITGIRLRVVSINIEQQITTNLLAGVGGLLPEPTFQERHVLLWICSRQKLWVLHLCKKKPRSICGYTGQLSNRKKTHSSFFPGVFFRTWRNLTKAGMARQWPCPAVRAEQEKNA